MKLSWENRQVKDFNATRACMESSGSSVTENVLVWELTEVNIVAEIDIRNQRKNEHEENTFRSIN